MELINVPQLITQILGFLVMLWLLGRFAWKPLLQSLDDRRQKIAGDIGAAEKALVEMRAQIVQTVALATEKVIHERLDDAGHRKLIERFVDEVEAVQ